MSANLPAIGAGPPMPTPPWLRPLPAPADVAGVRLLRSVTYAWELGYRPMAMDIYLPPAAGAPSPLVMYIHGGGWVLGARDELGPEWGLSSEPFVRVARAGIAVASVSYRLSAEAVFPAQLRDVAAAARFLAFRAEGLGIDPDRLAVWGSSAGAQLALLLAQVADSSAAEGAGAPVDVPRFGALVDWCGPIDLREASSHLPLPPPSLLHRLFGADPADVPELATIASPIAHADTPLPPTMIAHGRDDVAVALSQSERLADRLEAAGTSVRREWTDGGHLWVGDRALADHVLDLTIAFLAETLGAYPRGPHRESTGSSPRRNAAM